VLYGKSPNGRDDTLAIRYDDDGWHAKGDNLIRTAHRADGNTQIETANNTQTKRWQFIVATWQSGQRVNVYLDGQLNKLTHPGDVTQGGLSNIDRLIIGKGSKDEGDASWKGLVGDIVIFNRALSAAEIEQLMGLTRRP